jgi:hypothetical protein
MTTLKKLSKYPTEREMWGRIKSALNHNNRRAYRVEAVATPGFPDIVWITERGIHFMELKAGPVKFRPLQIRFIKDAHMLGVTVWVVSQYYKRADICVLPGIQALAWPDCGEGEFLEKWLEEMTNG